MNLSTLYAYFSAFVKNAKLMAQCIFAIIMVVQLVAGESTLPLAAAKDNAEYIARHMTEYAKYVDMIDSLGKHLKTLRELLAKRAKNA